MQDDEREIRELLDKWWQATRANDVDTLLGLMLDHYLEVLKLKPGAMLSATPLARARAAGSFTDAH